MNEAIFIFFMNGTKNVWAYNKENLFNLYCKYMHVFFHGMILH